MPAGGPAAYAAAERIQARAGLRFAAALTVSALLHAGVTGLVASGSGARYARTPALVTPAFLSVRLLAPEDPLPAASLKTPDAAPKPSVAAPRARTASRAVSVARPSPEKKRQDTPSVITEVSDTTYYAARQLDRYPELKAALELAFPAGVAASESSGYVLLLVLIDAEGRVNDASVMEAAPDGVFDEEAKSALLRARFRPALKDGRAVRSRLIVHVTYGKPD